MSSWLPGSAIGLIALIGVVLFYLRQSRADHNGRRRKQIERSTSLLRAHRLELQSFLANDEVPPFLREQAMSFSDLVDTPANALELARMLAQRAHLPAPGPENAFVREAEEMRRRSPELATQLAVIIVTAALASILRWPESADLYEDVTATLAMHRRQDVDVVVAASSLHPKWAAPSPDRMAALA